MFQKYRTIIGILAGLPFILAYPAVLFIAKITNYKIILISQGTVNIASMNNQEGQAILLKLNNSPTFLTFNILAGLVELSV